MSLPVFPDMIRPESADTASDGRIRDRISQELVESTIIPLTDSDETGVLDKATEFTAPLDIVPLLQDEFKFIGNFSPPEIMATLKNQFWIEVVVNKVRRLQNYVDIRWV